MGDEYEERHPNALSIWEEFKQQKRVNQLLNREICGQRKQIADLIAQVNDLEKRLSYIERGTGGEGKVDETKTAPIGVAEFAMAAGHEKRA
jgi:hypothetical protein